MPSLRILISRQESHIAFAGLLITFLMLTKTPVWAEDSLTRLVADGKPWEMYVVKRRKSNILVFRSDGRGTITDGYDSIHPTWKAVPNGICIKPEALPERCLELSRTQAGITASQNGKTVFILKR